MKIKKINQELEIEVSVKNVRLPRKEEKVGWMDECEYIGLHSFSYADCSLSYSFFTDFQSDDEFNDDTEYELDPIYGNQYDCGGIIDIIPVIETEDNLETGTIYLSNNIPFIAASENRLICLTRIDYFIDGGFERIDYDAVGEHIEEKLACIQNW